MVALRQHGLPQRVCFTHNRFRTTCRYPFLPGTTYNRQGRLWIAEVDEDADGKVDTRSSYRYDDSGIRVAQREQVDSDDDGAFDEDTTTVNLVDHRNPTGYQQVLEETQLDTATEAVQRRRIFTLGLDVISQQDAETAYGSPLFFLYDGHGSTRALTYLGDYTMEGGLLVAGQLFRYDAYGNSIDFDPTAAYTNLLYSGEHLDTTTNQQYLRARYYDLATGRFNRLDPFAGNLQDPASLNKYLYVHADPVNDSDPLGLVGGAFGRILANLAKNWKGRGSIYAAAYALTKALIGTRATYVLGGAYIRENGRDSDDVDINKAIGRVGDEDLPLDKNGEPIFDPSFWMRPDILDHTPLSEQFYEIKSVLLAVVGVGEVAGYGSILARRFPGKVYSPGMWDPARKTYQIDVCYGIPLPLEIRAWRYAPGVIVYESTGAEDRALQAVIVGELSFHLAKAAINSLARMSAGVQGARAGGESWSGAILLGMMGAI